MAVTMKLKFASLGNAIRLDTGSTGVSSTALTISETGLISAAWSMPYQVGVRRFEYTPNNDDKFTADDIIFTGDKELIIKGASSYGNLVDVRNFADDKLLVYFQSPEREGAPLGIAQLVDKNNSTIGPNFHPVAATYHSSLVEVNGKINYTTGYPVINPRIYSIEATSSGLSQGGSTTVSNENLYFWDSGAASLDDKTQVYVWSDNRNTNYQSLYFAKSDGINITKPLSVLVNLSGGVETSAKFELAAVKNGFAIMFHKNFGEGFYGDLYLQIYNNDATARTAPIQISDTVRTSSNWHPTKIFEIDGGKIVTVFNNNQYRIFDASGNKLSDILTDSAFSGTGSVIATKGGFLSATPDYYSTNLHARELAHEWTGDAEANRIEGSDLRDFMSAGAGNDTLFGRGGDDELNGDLGDDLLDGGVGADTMRGGAGSDRFIVDNAKDTIIEYSGDAGTDTVTVAFSYTLSDGVENLELAGSAAIDGTGNALANTLVGNKAANTLRGGAGDDILDGGAGNDILEGGLGNDRYVIDSLRDVVSERANEGIDTIVSSLTYTLAAEFERLELVGAAKINGTGNAAANTLVGNLADNILRGGDGDDVLEGGAGNDTLYGSFETDASSGRDTLRGGAGNDIMFGGSGSDTYDGGGGIDTVLFKIALDGSIDDGLTLDLADSGKNRGQAEGETYVDVEVFKLTNGNDRLTADLLSSVSLTVDGRSGNDIIKTAAGDDVLDGGAGADRLEGGAGDDTYVVDDAGDVVVEAQEGGFDVIYSSVSYTLTNDTIEQIWLTGYGDIDVTGVAGNDVLSGNLGNNILDGRQGADSMFGLSGDDTFIVDDVEDFTQENGGEGTDTVVASISYTLAAGQEIERLKLAASTGTVGLTLIGNEFAQTLTGNGGANVLDGKGGADTLIGGGGSDTYTVDNSRDQVIEAVGGGRDTVGALISYKLAAGQEIETLRLMLATGKQNLNLTGNEFGQALIGNDGNNTLDGRGGADVMTGARGNDTYSVDSSADRVVEGVGGGIDRVVSLSHYRLAAGQEIETLQLSASTGTEKFNLIGNEFGQALIGNAGANSLEGKGGNDVLTGGQGADSFIFASALGADNVDRITDFSTVDTIRLSKSIFSALAAGELKANEFKDIARAKVDADDHILYDSRSGALFYDADGSGKVAAVKFAVLDNKAAITHADFLIV